jgi:hypothetical protein
MPQQVDFVESVTRHGYKTYVAKPHKKSPKKKSRSSLSKQKLHTPSLTTLSSSKSIVDNSQVDFDPFTEDTVMVDVSGYVDGKPRQTSKRKVCQSFTHDISPIRNIPDFHDRT